MHLWEKHRLHEQTRNMKKMRQSELQEGEKSARKCKSGSHPGAGKQDLERHQERLQFVT